MESVQHDLGFREWSVDAKIRFDLSLVGEADALVRLSTRSKPFSRWCLREGCAGSLTEMVLIPLENVIDHICWVGYHAGGSGCVLYFTFGDSSTDCGFKVLTSELEACFGCGFSSL